MITSIITKTLGCSVVRAAVFSLAETKAINTIIMKVVETTAKEHGINCHTWHTDNGMQFLVGRDSSIEITIKVSDATKVQLVSKALETIKKSGFDKEQLQKELLQVVLEQIKNH